VDPLGLPGCEAPVDDEPVEGALGDPEPVDDGGDELQAAVIIARMARAEITPVRP